MSRKSTSSRTENTPSTYYDNVATTYTNICTIGRQFTYIRLEMYSKSSANGHIAQGKQMTCDE